MFVALKSKSKSIKIVMNGITWGIINLPKTWGLGGGGV